MKKSDTPTHSLLRQSLPIAVLAVLTARAAAPLPLLDAAAPGLWPAFWIMPERGGDGPQ